jgi:hypothetical protein
VAEWLKVPHSKSLSAIETGTGFQTLYPVDLSFFMAFFPGLLQAPRGKMKIDFLSLSRLL